MAKKKGKKGGGGLNPRIYSGLSKKRMARGSGSNRCQVKQGDTVTVQFLEDPDEMKEFDQHQFQDGGRWNYVPCAGDECPLCADDDPDVSKIHYRFICNVWNFKTKRVEILEGPKTLAGRISFRFETLKKRKKAKMFRRKTWDVSKFATTPVEWDVESGDEDALSDKKLGNLKPYNLDEDIVNSMKRYFGDDLPAKGSKTALDDDDDEEDYEEDEYDEDDLDEMKWSEVAKIAKSFKIKTRDDDDEKIPKSKLIKRIMKKQG